MPPWGAMRRGARVAACLGARPFTLKSCKEFLAQHGVISSFWIDSIKSHCFVTYESVEQARAARSVVYGATWPKHSVRTLVATRRGPSTTARASRA